MRGYPVERLPRTILIGREASEIDQDGKRAGNARTEGKNAVKRGGVGSFVTRGQSRMVIFACFELA